MTEVTTALRCAPCGILRHAALAVVMTCVCSACAVRRGRYYAAVAVGVCQSRKINRARSVGVVVASARMTVGAGYHFAVRRVSIFMRRM